MNPYISLKQVQSNLPMWSPLLSSHLYQKVTFSCPVIENSYELNLFQEITCLKWPLFACPTGDLLI
jgi:hypothetical protein